MNCCQCGTKLRVTETRDDGKTVYRTRRCDPCDWLVTTREEVVEGMIPDAFFKKRDWAATNARRKGTESAV